MKIDCQAVFNYVKIERRCARVGVHGESLGGAVASYMASKFDVTFLFADRTFSSLADVAQYGFFRAIKPVFRLIYDDFNTTRDFAMARCYKVLSSDPMDTAIPDLASLKTGIAAHCLVGDNAANMDLGKV
jgi:hypothetical protein